MSSGSIEVIPDILNNLRLYPRGFFFLAGATCLQSSIKLLLLRVLSKTYSSWSVQTNDPVTVKRSAFKFSAEEHWQGIRDTCC